MGEGGYFLTSISNISFSIRTPLQGVSGILPLRRITVHEQTLVGQWRKIRKRAWVEFGSVGPCVLRGAARR